jgi:hypothetical protein
VYSDFLELPVNEFGGLIKKNLSRELAWVNFSKRTLIEFAASGTLDGSLNVGCQCEARGLLSRLDQRSADILDVLVRACI